MTNFKTYLALLAAGSLLVSCSKSNSNELVSDYQDQIKFYVAGEANGSPFQWYAGADDYGLITAYDINSAGVVDMNGSLEHINGTKANSIELHLRGRDLLMAPNTYNVGRALDQDQWVFTDPSGQKQIAGQYNIDLTAGSSNTSINYQWTFANGQTANGPTASVSVNEQAFNNFEISLETTTAANCKSSTTNIIDVAGNCKARMNISNSQNIDFNALVQPVSGTITQVNWKLNGNNLGSGSTISGQWLYSSGSGENTLEADVVFEGGCHHTITKEYTVLAPNLVESCNIDFSYRKEVAREYDPDQLGTAELVYYDASGKTYTSAYQDVEGLLTLGGQRSYVQNENGKKTVRFHFDVSKLELRSADGGAIILTNVVGEFAVAYP
ncbi:MAG: hypothetical protein ACPF9D_06205 [Owenweeksia sp.]